MAHIKIFTADLTQDLTEDGWEEVVAQALRVVRKTGRVDSTYAYDAKQAFALVKSLDGKSADVFGLTTLASDFAGVVHVCVGAGSVILTLRKLAQHWRIDEQQTAAELHIANR